MLSCLKRTTTAYTPIIIAVPNFFEFLEFLQVPYEMENENDARSGEVKAAIASSFTE